MTNPLAWLTQPVKLLDDKAREQAEHHQQQLTKPPGSLGLLEQVAIDFAAWQGQTHPQLERVGVRIFAADHGVCAQQISAFPQQVTAQMVANFVAGGAAISVLSQHMHADFGVVNVGVKHDIPLPKRTEADYINRAVAAGTKDFTEAEAMTYGQMVEALEVGRSCLANADWQVFVGGEMGIGNTTAASAIFSALLKLHPEHTVGPGTGLQSAALLHKQAVIEQALALHKQKLSDPLAVLQCLGGFEIAALTASYIAAAQAGIPIIVDGFIATAAALLAVNINPGSREWMLFAHQSAEPAHRSALDALKAKPLLDLGLRLGEGSGAALALPLVQSALRLHNTMATFASAGVSEN